MSKKDILEIRRLFSPKRCCISRICGCYVDHEKNKLLLSKDAFFSLPEEEEFKYFEIFKKTLSGRLGKNLSYLDFSTEAEMPDGTQAYLRKLVASGLMDDELLEDFYDRIIRSYHYDDHYYIVVIHELYDIPGRAEDGIDMIDASDNVYEHILVSLCPVRLSKAGLAYHAESNSIESRIRDWVVDAPMAGFVFPAFSDHQMDLHRIITYKKDPEEDQSEYENALIGAAKPLTPKTQKEAFNTILAETFADEGNYEAIVTVHEKIAEIMTEQKDSPDPVVLSKPDVRRILSDSGADEKAIARFEKAYDEEAGARTELAADNIAITRKYEIETPDIVIKVNPDRADLIETRVIDGRECLVIAVDSHIVVNGINVRTIPKKETEE